MVCCEGSGTVEWLVLTNAGHSYVSANAVLTPRDFSWPCVIFFFNLSFPWHLHTSSIISQYPNEERKSCLFTNRETKDRLRQGKGMFLSNNQCQHRYGSLLYHWHQVQIQLKEWGWPRALWHDVTGQACKPGLLVSRSAAFTDLLVLSLHFWVYLLLCL